MIDLDAIRERQEWRKTMGGQSPGVHPNLLEMEWHISSLLEHVARLQAVVDAAEALRPIGRPASIRQMQDLEDALRAVSV